MAGTKFLSTNDLNTLRAIQEDALPDACVIYSVAQSTSSTGEQTFTETLVGTVDCRLAAQTAPEKKTAEQIAQPDTYILTLAHDGTLEPTSRVVYNSGTFEVVSVERAKSWQTCKRAIVRLMV